MHNYIDKNILLTCSEWFVGPDGQQYKAIWGKLKAVKAVKEVKKELQIEINRAHSNWFYEIGDFIVMGCQVKFLCLCPDPPPSDGKPVTNWQWDKEKGILQEYNTPSYTYISK